MFKHVQTTSLPQVFGHLHVFPRCRWLRATCELPRASEIGCPAGGCAGREAETGAEQSLRLRPFIFLLPFFSPMMFAEPNIVWKKIPCRLPHIFKLNNMFFLKMLTEIFKRMNVIAQLRLHTA